MADFDDEDAPDVDYEGEEEEEDVEEENAFVEENQRPRGNNREGRVGGDSETDDDGALMGPPPPSATTANNDAAVATTNNPLTKARTSPPLLAKMDRALDAPRDDIDETLKILHKTNNKKQKEGDNHTNDDRYDHNNDKNNNIENIVERIDATNLIVGIRKMHPVNLVDDCLIDDLSFNNMNYRKAVATLSNLDQLHVLHNCPDRTIHKKIAREMRNLINWSVIVLVVG
jgi:hypothetical protein